MSPAARAAAAAAGTAAPAPAAAPGAPPASRTTFNVAPEEAPAELKRQWDLVRENYARVDLHEAFVQKCFGSNQLPFASLQYRQIIEANPSDDLALKMRDRIIALSTAAYIPQRRQEEKSSRGSGLTWLLIGAGVLLVLTGLMSKDLRGVAGVGAAMVVIGVGVRRLMN